jgi:hypothetical protein
MHYTDQTFSEREIILDGNTFERCTFDRCQLVFAGKEPVNFEGNCSFNGFSLQLRENALYTIYLLAVLSSDPFGMDCINRLLATFGFQLTIPPGPVM